MSSRTAQNTGNTSDQSLDAYPWSEWAWDAQGYRWYRTRVDSNGKPDTSTSSLPFNDFPEDLLKTNTEEYIYDYAAPLATSSSVPRSQATLNPASSYVSGQNFGSESWNQEYEYQDSQGTSAAVSSLADDFTNVSISAERRPPVVRSTPYDNGSSGSGNNPVSQSTDYQPTLPLAIAISPSRLIPTTTYGFSASAPAVSEGFMNSYPGRVAGVPDFIAEDQREYEQATQPQVVGRLVTTQTTPNSYDYQPQVAISTSGNYPAAGIFSSSSSSNQQPDFGEGTSSGAATPKPSHKVISGIEGAVPGQSELLDPRYQVQPSRKFEPGKVFKVLWSEPQGANVSTGSEITRFTLGETRLGQKVHSSIRRFIIVANGQGCSQCVPITTYGHQATTKGGINRYDHAIVYMNNAKPKRLKDESKLSKDAIQVISKNPRDKLEADSRVNYGKIYTVEHNVKVLFIGKLAKESERTFMTDFDATWDNKPKISY